MQPQITAASTPKLEPPMKVELRKLAIYARMSEETTAFAADLWIDGVKVGFAKNGGRGGNTLIDWLAPPVRRAEIETALKALVPTEFKFVTGVEWAVDKIVEAKRSEKEIAKQDAGLKRSWLKRGTCGARFDISEAGSKEMIWVEYGPGGEAACKTQMQEKYPSLANWTVIA